MRDSLIILLHGVGSNGGDLMHLGDIWREMLPGAVLAAPDAPFASDAGRGHQWFSVAGVTAQNRGGRVVAARPAFDATLRDVIDGHGFSQAPGRVALAGFSQGGIMALDALASGRWPLAVVALSARLATPEPLAPAAGSAVLLVHGEDDRIIPARESQAAAERLERAGVDTELFIEPGLDHTISPEGAMKAADFLARRLGTQAHA
ncbi:prolyl oligopeptidase family serine peptidase [Labrys sp. LIt4]|uniref:Phospholipase n=1 Tax=Labrys okinawensis TaxID=346911 RepID=A0A2S9Q9J9_9HYPH|nr:MULTISPECIES: prolyl oligopeptidase family serine peptidase [Labrys]MBP0581701.1 prolyl oligopeptidase family serine peptidase [Labrys sp. LIt4]PRH86017.1 phospholipase [Labrys okinawensis]